jgi:hypothetical protein
MTKNYLFPARFQKFGWMLLVPFGIMFLLFMCGCDKILGQPWMLNVFTITDGGGFGSTNGDAFSFVTNDVFDEVAFVGLISSLILIAFSKEKDEDEFITQIRLNSLVWALLINYGILIFAELFIYGMAFLPILYLNLILILVLFVIKFRIALFKLKKTAKNEE